LVATTSAPVMSFPDGPVTVPRMVPVNFCAKSGMLISIASARELHLTNFIE
jgi:hypothetical protein